MTDTGKRSPDTVLVVEDDPVSALHVCNTAIEAGYNVVGPFESVSKARQAALSTRPNIAVLDVELIDGTSFAFARHLQSDGIVVVFVTSRRDLCQEAGFRSGLFIDRPVVPEAVEKALSDAEASAAIYIAND